MRASGNAPKLGIDLVRPAYKAAVLFELRAREMAKWRNAVDSHHTPVSRSALFSKQARFARPVDIPKWCPWQDLHLHCRRFGLRASALGYTGGRMVLPVRFALTLHGV